MMMERHIKNLIFMVSTEIKKMYSGSFLGILWFVLNPLLYSFVYYILFDKILQIKFFLKIEGVSYFEYLIIGLILWNGFVVGLLKGTTSILENAHIFKKVFIPALYFPITASLIPFIQSSLFLFILLFLGVKFDLILMVSFVISIISFYMFLLGLVLIFSSLAIYIRDIPQFLNNSLNFVFYSIPIIYPYENTPPFFREILSFNPLFYIFRAVYNVLFYKELDIIILLISAILGFLVLILGLLIFNKLKEGFYDVL